MSPADRKQAIVDTCLATFMKKGLAHTSTKDLCDALHLNSGGVFYYFKSKDDIIIACAEEAAIRIERDLIGVAMHDVEQPEKMAKDLHERANQMRNLMKFFVTVVSSSKYSDAIQPSLDRLSLRYQYYVQQFAEKLACPPEEIAPHVYIVINTMLSYMLFGRDSFVAPQLVMVYHKVCELLERKRAKSAEETHPSP